MFLPEKHMTMKIKKYTSFLKLRFEYIGGIMSEKPLNISELIHALKAAKKQFGNLPVMFYTGKEENRVYVNLCKEPKEIKIMEDRDREENHVLRRFALIK